MNSLMPRGGLETKALRKPPRFLITKGLFFSVLLGERRIISSQRSLRNGKINIA
jgi:hypothetical protein